MKIKHFKKYLRIYLLYFSQYLKSRLIYKTDFVLGATGQLVNMAVSLAFLTLIFTQINALQGWSFNEMLFLAGFGGLVVFTHNVFMFNIYRLGDDYILTGDFDRFLVRPLSPLFQIYADDIRDNNMPKVVANIALIIYAAVQLGLTVTFTKLVYGFASFVSGVMVVAAVYLLFATTAFWTGTSRNAIWLLFRISDFRKYPFDIFGLAIQVMLVTLVPLAFASFFPAAFLLDKPGFEFWKMVTPFVGPLFLFVAWKYWRFGLSRYSSTGS